MDKAELRALYLEKLRQLSPERRESARESLLNACMQLEEYEHVLSFYPMPHEVDIHASNAILARLRKLYLPRIEGDALAIYRISDLKMTVARGKSQLMEPDPLLCRRAKLSTIECVLVPAIAFDGGLHRIGYGRGHYDRLLAEVRKSGHARVVGICFFEQMIVEKMPVEPFDQSVDELWLG